MTTRGQLLAALTGGDGQLEDEVTAEIRNDVVFLRTPGKVYPLIGLRRDVPVGTQA